MARIEALPSQDMRRGLIVYYVFSVITCCLSSLSQQDSLLIVKLLVITFECKNCVLLVITFEYKNCVLLVIML